MYRKVLICIILALMTFAISFGPFTMAVSNTVQMLRVSGISVVDGNGLSLGLSGVHIGLGQGESFSLTDFETAKSLGFNALRTNDVYWGVMQPYNESLSGIDAQYFATGISIPTGVHLVPLDSLVNMAIQENMYLVICPYPWAGWYVPPQWAFPAISHAGSNQVWGGKDANLQAFTALINGTAAKERTGFINLWKFIANRYRDVPNVIFELLNEPMVLDSSLAGMPYKTFNEQIISAIESVETFPHLKLIELLRDSDWLEITQGAMDVNKPNIVWVSHHYVPWDSYDPNGVYWRDDSFTWHGKYFPAGWGNGTTYVAWSIIRVASLIHSWNRPWMVTEFGKPVTQAHYGDWLKAVLATMAEQQVVSWFLECYSSNPSNDPGWNIDDLTTRQEIMPLLAPYMATSTTSTSVNSTTQSQVSQTTSTSSTTSVISTSTNSTTSSISSSNSSTVTTPTSTTQTSSVSSTILGQNTTTSSTSTSVTSSTTVTLSSTTSSTVSSTTTSVSSSTSKVSAQMFTAVSSGQGSVAPNCPNGCSETVGSEVTVTANPRSGWVFSGWSPQSGQSCSSNPCTFNMPNAQVTLKATFTRTIQTLTTNVASGSGSVNPNCPGPNGCSAAVKSSISVQATPVSGWQFSTWNVTGASCSGGASSNPCTFAMPNNPASVSAIFTRISAALNTGIGAGSGSVSLNCPSGCKLQFGSSVSVSANATIGWTFSSWTVTGASCSGGSSSNPCTFTMPSNDVTLSAIFTQIAVSSTTSSVSSSTMPTLSSTSSTPTTTATSNSTTPTSTTSVITSSSTSSTTVSSSTSQSSMPTTITTSSNLTTTSTSIESTSSSIIQVTTSVTRIVMVPPHTILQDTTSTTAPASTVSSESTSSSMIQVTTSVTGSSVLFPHTVPQGQEVPPATVTGPSYSWFYVLLFSLGGLLIKPINPLINIRSKLRRLVS